MLNLLVVEAAGEKGRLAVEDDEATEWEALLVWHETDVTMLCLKSVHFKDDTKGHTQRRSACACLDEAADVLRVLLRRLGPTGDPSEGEILENAPNHDTATVPNVCLNADDQRGPTNHILWRRAASPVKQRTLHVQKRDIPVVEYGSAQSNLLLRSTSTDNSNASSHQGSPLALNAQKSSGFFTHASPLPSENIALLLDNMCHQRDGVDTDAAASVNSASPKLSCVSQQPQTEGLAAISVAAESRRSRSRASPVQTRSSSQSRTWPSQQVQARMKTHAHYQQAREQNSNLARWISSGKDALDQL